MGRDYEPPVRDRDDIALRPVHRPPRIRGEREPRGSASRVSDDVLGLDERTERAERETAARSGRTPEERPSGDRGSRADDGRGRPGRSGEDDPRRSEEARRSRAEEPRRPRADDERRSRADDPRRAREDDKRGRRAEDPRGPRAEGARGPRGEAVGRPRGDETGRLRGAGRGSRTGGRGADERRTRGAQSPAGARGLRDEDHGPRLEHERVQGDPRRPQRPAKPGLTKQPRQAKPARPIRPDEAADRAMGAGRSVKSKKPDRGRSGPSLLDDATRARYEMIAREQAGLRAAWATFRIHTDDLRRNNAQARTEAVVKDGFDRTTAELTDRGYSGPGGGKMNVVGRPVEYRATTAQVAGLWPWSVGAGAPLIGTPLGSHLHTGAPVCFDPMNWFMRGSFITAPSLFVLGLNGFGKSSLVRRIVLGGIAQGITPLILADVKPDYRKMVELVGGQVIDLGYGHGKLNPLAAGVLGAVVPRLGDFPALQRQVLQDLRARQVTLVAGLVELVRGARVADFEETLIATALRILYQPGSEFTPDKPPIMENLLEVIVGGGAELMLDAGADNADEYQNAIKNLRRSLRALTQGPFGAIFNGQTSVPIDTDAVAVCIDVSHIPTGDKKLKAAVMLACWADGFASVEAAHVLADAKMGPQRYFQVVMDELWQVLGLGDFMVDRVDELTRLQRGLATALIMISHTIKDLQALGSDAAIAKAIGFLERARAKIFGALPAEEISRLDSTVPFTAAEQEMVTGWSAPQALTGEALRPGQQRPSPPGTGKFLLKIGEDRRPGIPFHMEFTVSEKESGIHDTNQRFSEFGDNPRGTPAYDLPPAEPSANGGQP
ncbi:hypothetical protein [Nocardia mangyaensis]|uniref:hypothetical protein n=1 Tax=Nocardia mangyaensis TaxID=2213200 RepID=UPI0026767B4D|nr:hypothetical protein [Nocardia mangyaensis]MDO3646677.1 hypothetical protein [Nocardia mangyaensis]